MKKKKTRRVYFIVNTNTRNPIESELDSDKYPSSVACYTNKKDAKKDLASLAYGYCPELSSCIVSFDLEF
jgi:hypothetical protein